MLENNKDAILRELDRKCEKALTMIGTQASDYATTTVQENEASNSTKYPTEDSRIHGRLADNIKFEVDPSDDSVYIGTNVEYAQYVEFGHLQEVGRFVPAIGKKLVKPTAPEYPFLRPAVEDHIDEYKRMAEDIMEHG